MNKDLLESEREWRRYLVEKVEKIESSQTDMLLTLTTLKVKVGAFSSLFGAVGAMFVTWISKKMGL
jgi:hypothetical protein